MSAEVVQLETVTKPSSPIDLDLIQGLEALLDLARAGTIQGIAYTTIQSFGAGSYEQMGTGWRGSGVDCNFHTVLGGLAIVSARLIAEKQMYE